MINFFKHLFRTEKQIANLGSLVSDIELNRFKSDEIFVKLIDMVLNSEGGYVNHPADPGGPTFRGIAWNYNREILKSLGVTDIRQLTKDEAKYIYYKKYWLPSFANNIPEQRLAYTHFDAAVNCGVEQAKKFLSRLTTPPNFYKSENGTQNEAIFLRLFIEYNNQRLEFYTHAKNRKSFLEGWTNRLVDVTKRSLKFYRA